MPHAIIPLPDVYETVVRKVSVDAVRQIGEMMSLPGETSVYLPGRSDTVPMNDGMFGNCCDSDSAIHFDPEERVTLRYEEIADEMFALTTAVQSDQNFPIFADCERDITIRPVRRFVDFRIDIEYQAPNIVLAQRWLDDQRIRLSRGGAEMTMSLTYHYNVPVPCLALLRGLYTTMQKSCWPTELTFEQWLQAHWCQPITEMATLVDTHPTLAVYERQVDVVGWFDFTNTPETPQPADDKSGAYVVNFSYYLRYDRPTHVYCTYPLVVHQCPIPKLFRPKYIYQNYQAMDRKTTSLRGTLDHLFLLMRDRKIPYIQYPDTDDWVTQEIPKGMFTFFTGLLSLDKEDPYALLSLEKLGRFKFTGWFLEYFATVGQNAFDDGSFFEVRLYENNQRLRVPLVLDPTTLVIKSTATLNPHRVYHVQISLRKNLYGVNDRYWQCLRRYPTVFWSIMKLLNIGVGRKPLHAMQLLGLSGPRPPSVDCPGEGTTQWTEGLDRFTRGVVKWGDVAAAREEADKGMGEYIDQNSFGPLLGLFNHIITERGKD